MPADIRKVEAAASLPPRVDCVVIGGGIIGAATAFFLAERGISVALCEKGEIGAEQSGRNWGWVRVMGRDPAEIPLAVASQRLWTDLDRVTGEDTGFRRAGILYLCDTEAELDAQARWAAEAAQWQIASKVVRGAELDALIPAHVRPFAGALYTSDDSRAEPQLAAPALARGAQKRGAAVLTRCAVRGVETAAGRVSGVVTEKGPIACSSVVLAGGVWSRLFCGTLGIDFPQLKLLGSVCRTAPMDDGPTIAAGASDFAYRKRADGGYTIARRNSSISDITPDSFRLFFDFLPQLRTSWSELRLRVGGRFMEEWRMPKRWRLDEETPFERVRILDPAPHAATIDEGLGNLVKAMPYFAGAKVVERWGGLIDATPDGVPVIAPVAKLPGFFLASGFSGHGFGLGPGAGRLAADLVAGATPLVDPAPFRLDRFARAA